MLEVEEAKKQHKEQQNIGEATGFYSKKSSNWKLEHPHFKEVTYLSNQHLRLKGNIAANHVFLMESKITQRRKNLYRSFKGF